MDAPSIFIMNIENLTSEDDVSFCNVYFQTTPTTNHRLLPTSNFLLPTSYYQIFIYYPRYVNKRA